MKRTNRAPMGGTKKITISLRAADLDVMTRLAARRHGGNLSGAFADLIGHATRLEAMDRVHPTDRQIVAHARASFLKVDRMRGTD